MKVTIIDKKMSETDIEELLELAWSDNHDSLYEKYNTFDSTERNFELGTTLSFNENKYRVFTRIEDNQFNSFGYVLLNIEINKEYLFKDECCDVCGNSSFSDAPFGDMKKSQLEKIVDRENVKQCFSCNRIFEVIDEKQKTLRPSSIYKLKLK